MSRAFKEQLLSSAMRWTALSESHAESNNRKSPSIMSLLPTSPLSKPLDGLRHFGQTNIRPYLHQRLYQMFDIGVGVMRRRGNPQPLGASRHRRIVDRLDINAIAIDQCVADLLAQHRITNHDRHDVAGIVEMRDAGFVEPGTQPRHPVLMPRPFF